MADREPRDRLPGHRDGAGDPAHVADDLEAGQGESDDPLAVPAEDVARLAAIRPPNRQDAVLREDDVDTLGEITDTRIYEGELEARPPDSDQPDEAPVDNLELLVESEFRDGETDDPNEAAEEGMSWVPPTDPPVIPDGREPRVAAGFGTTADDEPFDADHHSSLLPTDDERTERVIEAIRAHASTAHLADRLDIETVGSRVVIRGVVDDIADEDELIAVASEAVGVSSVESRVEVATLD